MPWPCACARRASRPSRIVLMHQHVDGEPGVDLPFMDWPCTEGYCRAFAQATGMRLLFQWRHGGFHREMLKQNAMIAPVSFEYLGGGIGTAGGVRGKVSTRRLFPQVTADLSKRWCSPSLKIDVATIAINNEPAFKGKRLLFLSGERRQESAARSKYAEMEQHRTHTKSRHVDHWRMVIDWTEDSRSGTSCGSSTSCPTRLTAWAGGGCPAWRASSAWPTSGPACG